MKILASLFAVGISFFSYSQGPNNQEHIVELDHVAVSTANMIYLETVQDQNTPKEVALLQKQAAIYDVRTSREFDPELRNEASETIFKNSKGAISAFYNSAGEIVSTYERFKDILLPRTVQQQLYKSHKDWVMVGNLYTSNYKGSDLIERSYKIRLQKGDDKKSQTIHLPRMMSISCFSIQKHI